MSHTELSTADKLKKLTDALSAATASCEAFKAKLASNTSSDADVLALLTDLNKNLVPVVSEIPKVSAALKLNKK